MVAILASSALVAGCSGSDSDTSIEASDTATLSSPAAEQETTSEPKDEPAESIAAVTAAPTSTVPDELDDRATALAPLRDVTH